MVNNLGRFEQAAKVIDMAVGKNHRNDWPIVKVFTYRRHGGGSCFAGGERVNNDPSGLTFDYRHVGKIVSTHLVDPLRNLKQALDPKGILNPGKIFATQEDSPS